MKWSQLHIPTLRETPAEAEAISHQLLLRAGYVRQLAAGLYNYLFLAQRSLGKIQAIVREEMNAIGAQELLLPALQPAELWKETGRWDAMGANLFRLKDRFGRELCLGMTHEENMTALARGELRSYKQLPQLWYQIQTKYRDEPRPKAGLLRVRQFLMKDSYSFDIDGAGLDESYEKHRRAYERIFTRCGLRFFVVPAHSGSMGGSQSHEFMVASEAGEDFAVLCRSTGYAANLEKAVSRPAPPLASDPEGNFTPEPFHTPNQKTIADLSRFTGLPESSQMKSLVMVADGKPFLLLLRGDHQLSEAKFQDAAGAQDVRPAYPAEIIEWFGAAPGSLGPVGVANIPVLADKALEGRRNMICGANRDDYHLRHVTPGEDFAAAFHDLRQVAAGDTSVETGEPLEILKTIEIGHIFKLGYRYAEAMGLRVLDESGQEKTVIMGSYGIEIERILCAAVEASGEPSGMCLPRSIAPFEAVITPVNFTDPSIREAAERLYAGCRTAGIDVLLDDRDERPGVKFKDADLIGIPYRITIGKKLAEGKVELAGRFEKRTVEVALADVVSALQAGL
ncbi:MAG: proline--tRNA ligase [Acidobacteria bacterium]|nr:proline--tRNA ligase [Acidobacteriota bacterium]